MARYTSLHQSPRSPLIQGRTRWERPLWQSWAGGAAAAAVLLGLAARLVLHVSFDRLPIVLVLAVLSAGSLIGALLARMWGWRERWLGSALMGALGTAAAYAAWLYFAATKTG